LEVLFFSNNEAVPIEELASGADLRGERALDDMGDKQAKKSEAAGKSESGFTSRLAKAMRHPLRIRLLALMNERPWSPRELSLETGEGLSLVSYHVKVLRDLEMIEETSNRPVRGAVEHFYRAIARAYISPEMARHIPKSAQELAGIDIIREIDKDVGEALGGGAFYRREDWHLSWTPLLMDDEGCGEAERIVVQAVKDIIAVAESAATRLVEGGPDLKAISIGLGVLLYGRSEEKKKKAPPTKAKKRTTSTKTKKRRS
jgi:DNA-binding transcriptional ArsR family regulator